MAIRSTLFLDCLHHQMNTLEKAVMKRLKPAPAYEQLLTVESIGAIMAPTIVLETGHMRRLPTVSTYASYGRCVTRTKISHGQRQQWEPRPDCPACVTHPSPSAALGRPT